MTAPPEPVDKILGLLSASQYPNPNVEGSPATTVADDTPNPNLKPRDLFRMKPHFYQLLHMETVEAAVYMSFPEEGTDEDGVHQPSWTELKSFFKQLSSSALRMNPKFGLEGKAGLRGFLGTSLFFPLNTLIKMTLRNLPGELMWCVGDRGTAKPDFHLLWAPDDGAPSSIAFVKLETPSSCPDQVLEKLVKSISAPAVMTTPDGRSCNSTGDYPRMCQILDEVRLGLGGGAVLQLTEQLRTCARQNECHFFVLGNGARWTAGYVADRHAGESNEDPGKIFWFGRSVSCAATPTRDGLANSLLGLLFGITLLALNRYGEDISTYSHEGGALRQQPITTLQPLSKLRTDTAVASNQRLT